MFMLLNHFCLKLKPHDENVGIRRNTSERKDGTAESSRKGRQSSVRVFVCLCVCVFVCVCLCVCVCFCVCVC